LTNKRLNYVTNFNEDAVGGGWDGINNRMFNAIKDKINCRYIGPINPPSLLIQKIQSKILRLLFSQGHFFFFSNKRLNKIAKLISEKQINGPVFYFGATPWVKIKNDYKYYTYLDVCFHDYVKLFSSFDSFDIDDLQRISNLEAEFLSKAQHIFWGSTWAQKRAEEIYNRKFIHSTVISTGGVIDIPLKASSPENRFNKKKILFISTNFEAKGGRFAFEAMEILNSLGYKFTLEIVGAQPQPEYLENNFVRYHGYLNKTNPMDLDKLTMLYDEAFILLHPTSMDTMGAVIAEAGYFGLPCIAPNAFGIPDLILDGQTGILINTPINVKEIVGKIIECSNSKIYYTNLVNGVIDFMRNDRSWDMIANKILKVINEDINS
jgi:glycosyltransferase involved in cell wall biosynthesis